MGLSTYWAERRVTVLQRIVELGATTASGTGSPIGSVAAGTGSPIGQWRLVRDGASPPSAPTTSISCCRVREATGTPGGPSSPRPLAHQHQFYTLWLWCQELRSGPAGSRCRWGGRLLPPDILPPLFLDFGMTNSTTSDYSAYLPNES